MSLFWITNFIHDFTNRSLGDAEHIGNLKLCKRSMLVKLSNLTHLIHRQFSLMVACSKTLRKSPLVESIFIVFSLRPRPKMNRINTRTHVSTWTIMEYVQATWDRSKMQNPTCTVSKNHPLTSRNPATKMAVSLTVQCSIPNPTRFRFGKLLNESAKGIRGKTLRCQIVQTKVWAHNKFRLLCHAPGWLWTVREHFFILNKQIETESFL